MTEISLMALLRKLGRILFFVLATISFPGSQKLTNGQFSVQKNSISVLSPQSMRSKHDSSIGTFGAGDVDGFTQGPVLYPNKGSLGCKPFEGNNSLDSFVVLLDRGDCYFVLKTWNAQQAGAKAVLVTDYVVEPLFDVESTSSPYIERIHIPPSLITKSLGDSFKKALNQSRASVMVEIEWKGLKSPI